MLGSAVPNVKVTLMNDTDSHGVRSTPPAPASNEGKGDLRRRLSPVASWLDACKTLHPPHERSARAEKGLYICTRCFHVVIVQRFAVPKNAYLATVKSPITFSVLDHNTGIRFLREQLPDDHIRSRTRQFG